MATNMADDPNSDEYWKEKLRKYTTAPYDARFPNTNQTRNCYQNFLDFHRCNKALAAKGESTYRCMWFKRVYRSLCPKDWVDTWNEQIEAGTFAGRI